MDYKKIASELCSISSELDRLGKPVLADKIDDIVAKFAQPTYYDTSSPSMYNSTWQFPSEFNNVRPSSITNHFFDTAFLKNYGAVDSINAYIQNQKIQPWQTDKVINAIVSDPRWTDKLMQDAKIMASTLDPQTKQIVLDLSSPSAVDDLVSQLAKNSDDKIKAAVENAIKSSPEFSSGQALSWAKKLGPAVEKTMLGTTNVMRKTNRILGALLAAVALASSACSLNSGEDSEMLENEMNALKDMLQRAEAAGADSVKVERIKSYALNKVNQCLDKTAKKEPGFVASDEQKNTLMELQAEILSI